MKTCGHDKTIKMENDATCVQCSDGCIDLCGNCIDNTDEDIVVYMDDPQAEWIKRDEHGDSVHPYDDYISDWVFNGTVKELKIYLKSLEN